MASVLVELKKYEADLEKQAIELKSKEKKLK